MTLLLQSFRPNGTGLGCHRSQFGSRKSEWGVVSCLITMRVWARARGRTWHKCTCWTWWLRKKMPSNERGISEGHEVDALLPSQEGQMSICNRQAPPGCVFQSSLTWKQMTGDLWITPSGSLYHSWRRSPHHYNLPLFTVFLQTKCFENVTSILSSLQDYVYHLAVYLQMAKKPQPTWFNL